ncbi:MAG: DUF4838 domain-containing protein [Lachnospiraceae bacterium]|nr:DUF4838 domain-containing protein [Lachnospiraceae bacterium]
MRVTYESTASETVQFAASQLRAYLERMLPDDFAVRCVFRLRVLPELGSPLRKDCFRVNVSESEGTIAGNNDRSVLLGVYDYLHFLGCRFLAPGKAAERVPFLEKAALSANYERQASFFHRGVCIEGADSFENIRDFIDWLPKVGYNTFFLQFKVSYIFMARYYHHRQNPFREPEAFTVSDAAAYDRELEREIKRRGILLHRVGHGWTGETLGYEAISWDTAAAAAQPESASVKPAFAAVSSESASVKPASAAVSSESVSVQPDTTAGQSDSAAQQPGSDSKAPVFPETFETMESQRAACVGGKRGLFRGIPANTNLCYHQKDAVNRFVDLVVRYATDHPSVDYLHIWLADDYNNVCECEDCRKTTVSDQYAGILNEIDRRLTAEGLSTRLVFLLYQELLWPPVKERLQNPERFVLMFAPISRTFEHSYSLLDIPEELPAFSRNQITLPTNLGENLAFLKGWQRLFPGDGFVYDYPLGRAHYGDFGYIHMSRIISEDIKKLREMGLNGYISCQELRAGLPNTLPNYVMGQMLFDREKSERELEQEYFEAAYGDFAPAAVHYLEKLSELECCDYVNGKGDRKNASVTARMEAVIACCEEFRAELSGKCGEKTDALFCGEPEGDTVELLFRKLLAYHRDYVVRLADAIRLLSSGDSSGAAVKWKELRSYICGREDEFQPWLDVYRVLEVTQNYTGFCGNE